MNIRKGFSNSTAILLFAQSEVVESGIKPITASAKQNVLLWKKMNEQVLKTIQQTKLSYYISNENNQVGNTFGEKLTTAIQDIFDKGFQNVIVVGNDCFQLKKNHLLHAANDLCTDDLVLGPDLSGGAYLIGLSKTAFNAEQFQNIPWQTKNVFAALQCINSNQSIAFLPSLNDCNSSTDFKKIIQQLPYFSVLKKLLCSFLTIEKQQTKRKFTFTTKVYYNLSFNKGSPVLQLL